MRRSFGLRFPSRETCSRVSALFSPLHQTDKELSRLISLEQQRQRSTLTLIASENVASFAVRECLGSVLTNKYSEGRPFARHYAGNGVIDQIEMLCQWRALDAFGLSPMTWGVNVQPLSGAPANWAVYVHKRRMGRGGQKTNVFRRYMGLLKSRDCIMGLDFSHGGHLTHGSAFSATSSFYESVP